MKIGIIYVGYQTEEYIESSLAPWIKARQDKTNDNQFCICAVSTPFLGFANEDKLDGTIPMLSKYLSEDKIDHLITDPKNILETQARGMALKWLIEQDVDIVWQVDSDEFYTLDQIGKISYFVELNPFITWFRLNLKNYVFTDKQYLFEPFTPPRIHRTSFQGFTASSFTQDNDIAYGGLNQHIFANMTVPLSIAFITHITWMNNERSRKKVEYQHKRWGHCSFTWNASKKKLEFDKDFYKKTGQSLPKIMTEGC
jgi:hypothetical protein